MRTSGVTYGASPALGSGVGGGYSSAWAWSAAGADSSGEGWPGAGAWAAWPYGRDDSGWPYAGGGAYAGACGPDAPWYPGEAAGDEDCPGGA